MSSSAMERYPSFLKANVTFIEAGGLMIGVGGGTGTMREGRSVFLKICGILILCDVQLTFFE